MTYLLHALFLLFLISIFFKNTEKRHKKIKPNFSFTPEDPKKSLYAFPFHSRHRQNADKQHTHKKNEFHIFPFIAQQ